MNAIIGEDVHINTHTIQCLYDTILIHDNTSINKNIIIIRNYKNVLDSQKQEHAHPTGRKQNSVKK